MAFPPAWPRLHDRSLEGALRGAVERVVVITATALLFPSKARWAVGRNWEWIDWGQFWLLPYTGIWGYPPESARGRWEEHSKWEYGYPRHFICCHCQCCHPEKGCHSGGGMKCLGGVQGRQGNLPGERSGAARKKGLLENLSLLPNMPNTTLLLCSCISFLLNFSVISIPKLFFSKGTKGKSGHPPVSQCTLQALEQVVEPDYA